MGRINPIPAVAHYLQRNEVMRSGRTCQISVLVALFMLGFEHSPAALAVDQGQEIFESACPRCHTPTEHPLENIHLNMEQWKEKIDLMNVLGAEIPEKKIPFLLDYVMRTHGPVGAADGGGK